jgi:mono/diheme cytochrome c family protein
MKSFAAVVFALAIGAGTASAQATAPTFNKNIAPILYANCTSCHRPGEIGPMSLLTYKDARPWAKAIGTRVSNGTMPPWHADPAYGAFKNERRLSDAQKNVIAQWVSAGAPEGKPEDLPTAPTYKEGWNMEPDAILSMTEDYPIPATGAVPYQYLEVPANFKEDRWITAWEIRPGDRKAVHHIIVQMRPSPATLATMMLAPRPPAPAPGTPRPLPLFTMTPQTQIPDGQSGGRPLPPDQRPAPSPNDRPRLPGTGAPLGGYVPGTEVAYFPEGTAMRLPAGYSLVFQMHYTTYGKATTDRTRIGLKFAKEAPKTVLNVAAMLNTGFKIPAGASNYQVDQAMTINRDVLIYSFVPHTHVRGTGWIYEATYPDGKTEVILSVPKYDFNWQHEYMFKEPLRLPAGSKISAKAWYNNSASNKSNPDPTKDVTWGDQTWEEMMYTSITFSVVAAPAPMAAPRGQQD